MPPASAIFAASSPSTERGTLSGSECTWTSIVPRSRAASPSCAGTVVDSVIPIETTSEPMTNREDAKAIRVLLVAPGEQAADAGRGQLMSLDGCQKRLTRQAWRPRRVEVERHHRDQVGRLAVAARRTRTEVIGVAASRAAAGEAPAGRSIALSEFMHRRRDVVGDPVRDAGARLPID